MHVNMRVVFRKIDQSTLCKRCIPLQGQHKGQKDERNISFLCFKIFGRPVMKSLLIKFIPLTCGLPHSI